MKKIILTGIFLMALLLFCQAVSADQAGDGNQKENIWNGTWEDDMYILYFEQNGTDITGIYEPYEYDTPNDLGKLVGNLSSDGTEFYGKWIVTTDASLQLADDMMSFSGISTYTPIEGIKEIKGKEIIANRTGEIADEENPWTGAFTSSEKSYNLTQMGSTVTGDSAPLPGFADGWESIEGVVSDDGKTLDMTATKIGGVTLVISDDGSYYNGTYTDDMSNTPVELYRNMTKVE